MSDTVPCYVELVITNLTDAEARSIAGLGPELRAFVDGNLGPGRCQVWIDMATPLSRKRTRAQVQGELTRLIRTRAPEAVIDATWYRLTPLTDGQDD